MKKKKIITLIIAGAIIAGSLAGCSSPSKPAEATTNATTEATATTQAAEASTETVTVENTTEASTEVVTDKDGKPVTEAVTDKNGEKVTDKDKKPVTKVVTKKSKTTTTTKKAGKKTTKKKTTTAPAGNNSEQTSVTQAASQPISIVLKKNMQAACASPNVSIATGEVYIEKGGDYVVTTETDDWHGQIIIKLPNTESCEVRFEGNGKITNSKAKNIIQIIDDSIKTDRTFLEAEQTAGTDADDAIKEVADNDKAPNVDLSFPTGSDWTFSSNANGYTGLIYNESKLTIKGNGKAKIESNNVNNCICSTKSITMKNLSLSMTAGKDIPDSMAKGTGSAKGIFSYSRVTVESGSLNIKSNGDGIRCDELNIKGGTVDIVSSACDGVDADDLINISGGTVSCKAYEKHCFKVRRVNNAEKGKTTGTVRAGKGDGFFINGGTVIGESKNISSLDSAFQSDKKGSAQASVTCKIVKQNKGVKEESKTPAILHISSLKKSSEKCVKFLYSSSNVKKDTAYKASAENGNSAEVQWKGNFGWAEIASATNK